MTKKVLYLFYLCFVESEDRGTQGAADVPLSGCRIVKKADLKWDLPVGPEVNSLDLFVS